ncbi:MAG: hypothetical protein Q3972_03710 [Corynebacterium sp.]|nr:hypothetical protein [Corynebacterium sp.]
MSSDSDLRSIGMDYPSWQEAVDAAIASNRLSVVGELGSGQLVQFRDPSGAQIIIVAAEPYAVFAGFFPAGNLQAVTAHITMIDRIKGRLDVLDANGEVMGSVEANIAQGPLLTEEKYQQVYLTLLGKEDPAGEHKIVVESARYATNQTSGQRYRVIEVSEPDLFTVVLPDGELPLQGDELTVSGTLSGVVVPPPSCGDGGGCGCGSGGCGSHASEEPKEEKPSGGCGGGGCGGGGCGGHGH